MAELGAWYSSGSGSKKANRPDFSQIAKYGGCPGHPPYKTLHFSKKRKIPRLKMPSNYSFGRFTQTTGSHHEAIKILSKVLLVENELSREYILK
jgi:hypothetical protein